MIIVFQAQVVMLEIALAFSACNISFQFHFSCFLELSLGFTI